MNNQLPTIACGIILIMQGENTGAIGVFINMPEN